MDYSNYIVPTGKLMFSVPKQNYNICFHKDGQEIGKFDFNGPKMVFTGDAEESAKVFVGWIAKSFEGRLEEERKEEREACAKVCEDNADDFSEGEWDSACMNCAALIRERSTNDD